MLMQAFLTASLHYFIMKASCWWQSCLNQGVNCHATTCVPGSNNVQMDRAELKQHLHIFRLKEM